MTSRRVIRPLVVEFLLERVGQPLNLVQITRGMPAGTSPESVQTCLRNIMRDGELEITVLARGKSWRLESLERPIHCEAPAPEPEPATSLGLFEQVGEMADGNLVVRDEANRLYVLQPL